MWRKSRAMEEKIRIENVTKKFGSYAALDGISLNLEKGKIHGIIGRNGSGKTVLFKCICGFLRVDGGAVLVNGKQIGKEIEAPESIGAIIETPGFLPGYSARQNLQFLAGIRGKIGKKEIDEAKSRPGPGSEKARRQIFPRYAPAPRHRTGNHGRSVPSDPGRAHERPRQPGRAGDAAAVFETERRRKNHSSCQPQPGRHCSPVRHDSGD